MGEQDPLDEGRLLRRLDEYFAVEMERAERDLRFIGDVAPFADRPSKRPSRSSALELLSALILVVVLGSVVMLSAGRHGSSVGSGMGQDIVAFDPGVAGQEAVVVSTDDGLAVVQRDGDVLELLLIPRGFPPGRALVLDRSFRIPDVGSSAGASSFAWYASGGALVCDEASGLHDRAFIYGWIIGVPAPTRMRVTGLQTRGDGRVVANLYLFASIGASPSGTAYQLEVLPVSGSPGPGQPAFRGASILPVPVSCPVNAAISAR